MKAIPLSHDTLPDTGHSYAAAWSVLTGFALLAGLLLTAGFQWAAMNHFFG